MSGVLTAFAIAQEPPTSRPVAAANSPSVEIMSPARPALEKGHEYLAQRQLDDGAFATGGYGRNAAVVAVAGMAWLASGSTPGRGPYGEEVARAADYLLEHAEASGFISVEGAMSHGPMYEHGFSTLFLAEVYGMSPRDDLREKLSRAVHLIVRTQNAEGGWRYQPRREEADLSVTVCQVMALCTARNAGLSVPNETIDRSIDYVKRCQNADGGFRYMLPEGESAFPRSAAGLVALYSAGIYEGREIDRGLAYINRFRPAPANWDKMRTSFMVITMPFRRCGLPAASAGSDGTRQLEICFCRGNRRMDRGRTRFVSSTARRWHASCFRCRIIACRFFRDEKNVCHRGHGDHRGQKIHFAIISPCPLYPLWLFSCRRANSQRGGIGSFGRRTH